MKVTETRIRIPQNRQQEAKAYVSVTLDDSLVVTGMSIRQAQKGYHYVIFPQAKRRDESTFDIIFPNNAILRRDIQSRILKDFKGMLDPVRAN